MTESTSRKKRKAEMSAARNDNTAKKLMREANLQAFLKRVVKNSNITRQNQLDSSLLGLPAEVRNHIYGYALGGNDCTVRHDMCAEWQRKDATGLLSVCRQTKFEATSFLYELNTFNFGGPDTLEKFIERHSKNVHHVASVKLSIFAQGLENDVCDGWDEAIPMLRKLPGLKNVEINLTYCWDEFYTEDYAEAVGQLKNFVTVLENGIPGVVVSYEHQFNSDDEDEDFDPWS